MCMQNNQADILILDFGSQYTQLIARRLREHGFYAEIVPYFEKIDSIKAKNPKGLILSGGPASIYEEGAYKPSLEIFDLNIPVLGICYGMQFLVDYFGGKVERADKQEYGKAKLDIDVREPIFKGISKDSIVWMSHADKVESLPEGFKAIASSDNTANCAFVCEKQKVYGFQFHPEVVHSDEGFKFLVNFALLCGVKPDFNMDNFLVYEIENLQKKIKSGKVLCAVSGGVDSSVVATLLYKALGERVIPVFVDTGLLREGERDAVCMMFKQYLNVPLITIDAKDVFLERLKGVTDPETKRKIIGETFIELFEKEAKNHSDIKYLAQGTLYPDVIESTSAKGPSKVIKSHHNVGGLPEKMNLELVEPLRELFKDEVRNLGLKLGMAKPMLLRHPFPGPGLAIRIMGSVDEESLHILRKADNILLDELHNFGFYNKVWQAFVVLLNVKSVGVMGDNRTYENTACVRVVEASDGMSAVFAHLPYELLEKVSSRIINEVDGINRVVYDISSKPPATIEWE
ncbi:glutamine-hydrolyzing GMP synthase [Helicobacter sp. 11S02629-2]|uniref:glutamine-hydrolyzing GMP synthase n=1 Tax=Helicobacter sp. 11S02629-2 TaxID=1476195 RepID=UPI000BA764A0|nr:glutamine-hydrolyzing GMP synthase [Helicobacter sp. 11S02629-2]